MSATVQTPGNVITAHALFESGKSVREVATILGISPYSAWALKRREKPDPSLIQHCSKTLTDRMVLASSAAVDTILDKAVDGELDKASPIELAKMSSILLQSAGAYAALSGATNMLATLAAECGIEQSHSVSRVTLEQKITVEQNQTPQPVVLDVEKNP